MRGLPGGAGVEPVVANVSPWRSNWSTSTIGKHLPSLYKRFNFRTYLAAWTKHGLSCRWPFHVRQVLSQDSHCFTCRDAECIVVPVLSSTRAGRLHQRPMMPPVSQLIDNFALSHALRRPVIFSDCGKQTGLGRYARCGDWLSYCPFRTRWLCRLFFKV